MVMQFKEMWEHWIWEEAERLYEEIAQVRTRWLHAARRLQAHRLAVGWS